MLFAWKAPRQRRALSRFQGAPSWACLQIGFHEENPEMVSMYLWYRWGEWAGGGVWRSGTAAPSLAVALARHAVPLLTHSSVLPRPPPALTPFLELYTTLERTRSEVDKYIVEEPVEGMPLVAAALFQEADGGSGAVVTLRISYLLPSERGSCGRSGRCRCCCCCLQMLAGGGRRGCPSLPALGFLCCCSPWSPSKDSERRRARQGG